MGKKSKTKTSKAVVCKKYTKYTAAIVTDMLRKGWTNEQIASALQVTSRTMARWMRSRAELQEAAVEATRPRDAEVVDAIYELATGAMHERVIEQFSQDLETGELKLVGREVHTETLPPNFQAAKFVAINRHGWHDRQEHDVRSVGIVMNIDAKDAEL